VDVGLEPGGERDRGVDGNERRLEGAGERRGGSGRQRQFGSQVVGDGEVVVRKGEPASMDGLDDRRVEIVAEAPLVGLQRRDRHDQAQRPDVDPAVRSSPVLKLLVELREEVGVAAQQAGWVALLRVA
jgi:hypothetical protein